MVWTFSKHPLITRWSDTNSQPADLIRLILGVMFIMGQVLSEYCPPSEIGSIWLFECEGYMIVINNFPACYVLLMLTYFSLVVAGISLPALVRLSLTPAWHLPSLEIVTAPLRYWATTDRQRNPEKTTDNTTYHVTLTNWLLTVFNSIRSAGDWINRVQWDRHTFHSPDRQTDTSDRDTGNFVWHLLYSVMIRVSK